MSAAPRLHRILHSDIAAAWVLVLAVGIALVWANGPWAHTYGSVWLHPTRLGHPAFAGLTTVRDWVNSGLMAVFFLVVGLEIGRERRHGDLDGEYIDSSEGYVTDELDFRRDHFAAAQKGVHFFE